MMEIETMLSGHRLLTLAGPGGSGKTRLALAVASHVVGRFEDGVWLVELAPLWDPDLLPQEVASVLGFQETPGTLLVETLVDHLEPRSTLLVLDNCEHLVDACASFAEALLRRCPNLWILATSREALGVAGETIFTVPPLSLPDPHHLPDAGGLIRYEASRLFVERAQAVRQDFDPELSDRQLTAPLLVFLGLAALSRNDLRQTVALLEDGLGQYREMGDAYGTAMCCGTLCFIALHQDDVDQAAGRFGEALHSLRELRDRVGMLHCLMGIASVNGLRGDKERAARPWGAAEALGEAASVPLLPVIESLYDYEGHVAAVRSQLGDLVFEAAWTEGRKMTPEQAVEYALLTPDTPAQVEAAQEDYPADLSAREVEVLRLVAGGMTNAQVARELYISPRTVNAHMGSIYHKIGSSTRAEAARFALEHGLL